MKLSDIDPERVLNVGEIYRTAEAVINLTANALDEAGKFDTALRSTIADLIRQLLHTHRSIQLLVGRHEEDGDYLVGADALSLAREQVEKVFAIWLLIGYGEEYLPAYFKDADKKLYQRHLVRKREFGDLDRFASVIAEQDSDLRSFLIDKNGWEEEELELVEHKLFRSGEERPDRLKGVSLRGFPTPGKIRELARNTDAHEYLSRWYQEYAYLCGFTHIGFQKQMLIAIRNPRSDFPSDKQDIYYQKTVPESVFISLIAIAGSCAEVTRVTQLGIDALAQLAELWDELCQSALVAQVFWKLRAKSLMGVVS